MDADGLRTTPAPDRRRRLQNRLLRALPPDEYRRLRPHLEAVAFRRGELLQPPGRQLVHVYFPVRGICSLVTLTETGGAVDVAAIGCEGLTGVCMLAAGGSPIELTAAIGRLETLRVGVRVFEREMDRHGTLHRLSVAYYHAFVSEMLQAVVCNRLHSAQQRFCRCVLTLSDRLGSNTFAITHDGLAAMLGIYRPAVTAIALGLQRAGSIRYTRGVVALSDRPALEAAACECYRMARRHLAGLPPPPPRRG